MNRFLSNATNRIDSKGRVSVPAAFRSVLAERDIQELYCFQDFVFPAISVGGLDLLDRFERQIAADDPFSPAANQMSLLIHGGGVFMKLDAEGRLMVTDFIRDFTGIARSNLRRSGGSFSIMATGGLSGLAGAGTRGAQAGGQALGIERGNGMAANSGGGSSDAGGGPARHIPVLLSEVIEALAPAPGKVILDGTFGAGGYTSAILAAGANVTALDRDPTAIVAGQALVSAHAGHLNLIQSQFSELADHAPAGGLDGIVLDIGVSSMQIDEAERGFSFSKNGPLDMRMSASGVSAADVVNRAKLADLIRIFVFLGEEKQAPRIAHAIEKRRAEAPFVTTRDLAGLIEVVTPRKAKDKIHPATRVFQALRIFVNDELGELAQALFAAERALKPGGRLVVVTFHSLEDRIVKKFFADRSGRAAGSRHMPIVNERPATFEPVGKSMISASDAEAEANPRARSAKLRAGVRTLAPAEAADLSIFDLPNLASLGKLGG